MTYLFFCLSVPFVDCSSKSSKSVSQKNDVKLPQELQMMLSEEREGRRERKEKGGECLRHFY